MPLPTITKVDLQLKINLALNAMPEHKGKHLSVFVTRPPGLKWSVGLHGDEAKIDGQALYDAQAISSQLTKEFDLDTST